MSMSLKIPYIALNVKLRADEALWRRGEDKNPLEKSLSPVAHKDLTFNNYDLDE